MNSSIAFAKVTSRAADSFARLLQMGRPLWSFLSFSLADERIAPKKNISLAVEKSQLSVVYGSRILSRFGVKEMKRESFEGPGYPQPEDFATAASLILNNLRAPKRDITLIVPKSWTVIRMVELPSVVRENIEHVVSYELDRLTPFSPDDSYYDFQILREHDGKLSVAIAAARGDLIEPYLAALREQGLAVTRVTVAPSCTGTLTAYAKGTQDVIVVEIDGEGYESAFLTDGTIAGGGSERFPTQDSAAQAEIVYREIDSLMTSARGEGKNPLVAVLLGDAGSPLREQLTGKSLSPVVIMNETDLRLTLPRSGSAVPYAALGGLLESLWSRAKGLNLLSKGRHVRPKSPIGLTVALFCVLVALWMLYLVTPFRIEEKRLAEIDREISFRKDEAKKVEALRKDADALSADIAAIHQFKENRLMTLETLKELTAVLPKTTWLTRVKVTETSVEIEGYASSATEMLPKIEASKFFRKAEFASPTFRDARMNADRFIMKAELEGISKPEGEGAKGEGTKGGKK